MCRRLISAKKLWLLLALITFNAIRLTKAQNESGDEDQSAEAGGSNNDGDDQKSAEEENENGNESDGAAVESGQNDDDEHKAEGGGSDEEDNTSQQHNDDNDSAPAEGGQGNGGGRGQGGREGQGGGGTRQGGGGTRQGGGGTRQGGGSGAARPSHAETGGTGTATGQQPNMGGQTGGQMPGGQPVNPQPGGGVQPQQTGGNQPMPTPGAGGGQPFPSQPYVPPSNAGGQYYPSDPYGGLQQPQYSSSYPYPTYPSAADSSYYPPSRSPYYPEDYRQPYDPYPQTYERGGGYRSRQNRPGSAADRRDFYDDRSDDDTNFGFGSFSSNTGRSLPPVINENNFDPGHAQGRLAGATFVPPEQQSHLPPVIYGASRYRRSAAVQRVNPYLFPEPDSAGHKRVQIRRNGGRRTKRRAMLCFVPSPATRQSGNMDFWRNNLLKYSPNQFQRYFPYSFRTNGEIHDQGTWGRRKRRQNSFPEDRQNNYGGRYGADNSNPSLICQPMDDSNGYSNSERGAPNNVAYGGDRRGPAQATSGFSQPVINNAYGSGRDGRGARANNQPIGRGGQLPRK